jgi:hypothetical protein
MGKSAMSMARQGFRLGLLVCAAVLPAAFAAAAGADDVPDFSGRWGRNAFNFEPLPGQPLPVDNIKRTPTGQQDNNQLVGDDKNPILKPHAAEIVRQKGEISRSGNAFPDPSNQCYPYQPPFALSMQLGLVILQEKDQITFLYNQDDQVRRVRLNSTHPAKVTPTWMGDSIGRYEGDTLVIDTVGMKIGPHSMVDRYGTPHSEAFHMIERYRLIDGAAAKDAAELHMKQNGAAGLGGNIQVDPNYAGKGLEVQFTIDDPGTYTQPWSAKVTYRRLGGSWAEQICAENTREYYDDKNTAVPTANRPDF